MDPASLTFGIVGTVAAGASAIIAWVARADSLRAEGKAGEAQAQAQTAAERAAAATEQMSMMQASVFNSPPWSFAWMEGRGTYLLTNTSSVDAMDVRVTCTAPTNETGVEVDKGSETVGARSAIRVYREANMGDSSGVYLIVTWRRRGDEQESTWRYPIPTAPKLSK